MILAALLPMMAQLAIPPELDCSDPTTQSAMNICAAQEYQKADAELNAQWSRTAAIMRERDSTLDREYDDRAGYFETLLVGQRAWLQFRDAHCAAEGYNARGGSLEPLLISTCQTALTQARTAQLLALVAWLE